MKITLTHNGMKVEFFSNEEGVENFIEKVLNNYKYLNPKKILDIKIENKQIIIYEYCTIYKEMFLVETEI